MKILQKSLEYKRLREILWKTDKAHEYLLDDIYYCLLGIKCELTDVMSPYHEIISEKSSRPYSWFIS